MSSITAFPQERAANRTRGDADPFRNGSDLEAGSERDEDDDRARVNLFAAVALIVLIAFGWCLVTASIETQKAQGCYASGARYCSLI
jgi:hypothetical protein